MSDLVVREICVALLERNVVTRSHRWGAEEGRMELKEGWEMVVHVLLIWSNLTQGSWMRMISVVWCVEEGVHNICRFCCTMLDKAYGLVGAV